MMINIFINVEYEQVEGQLKIYNHTNQLAVNGKTWFWDFQADFQLVDKIGLLVLFEAVEWTLKKKVKSPSKKGRVRLY